MFNIEDTKAFFKKNYLTAFFIIALIIITIAYFLFFKKPAEIPLAPPKEKTMEEILQDLTAPSIGEQSEVTEKVIQSLTAPSTKKKKIEVPESVIQSLTAPVKGQ